MENEDAEPKGHEWWNNVKIPVKLYVHGDILMTMMTPNSDRDLTSLLRAVKRRAKAMCV